MTLLTALQTLLGRYTGQSDVAVGSPIAGRTRKELEDLIGFFINTLVFRGDLSGDPTFRELLGRVRESCLGAYAHQDLPFEKLIEELQPQRDLSRHPIFQVVLVLQNFQAANSNQGNQKSQSGSNKGGQAGNEGWTELDMSLFLAETADGLGGVLRYSTDLFDESTIARFAGHLQQLLEQIVAHPNRRISRLQILSDAEQQQLLVDWNSTQAEYPADRLVHQLFEAQVDRAPNAVALKFNGREWTYRQLDREANHLVHILHQFGVGSEVSVAVCLERSATGSSLF